MSAPDPQDPGWAIPIGPFRRMLNFLTYDDLFTMRDTCEAMRVEVDAHFYPLVLPPWMREATGDAQRRRVAELLQDGNEMFRLFCYYQRWIKIVQILEVVSGDSQIDAFFSLAPWNPFPLRRADQSGQWSIELPNKANATMPPHYRERLEEWIVNTPNLAESHHELIRAAPVTSWECASFNRRERDPDLEEEERRSFETEPAMLQNCEPPSVDMFVLEPLNVRRKKDGARYGTLPDHNQHMLEHMEHFADFLRLFLPPNIEITSLDLKTHHFLMKHVQLDSQRAVRDGADVYQLESDSFEGASGAPGQPKANVFVLKIVPVHLTDGVLDWVFSSSLDDSQVVLSTHQIEAFVDRDLWRKVFYRIMLSAISRHVLKLSTCENVSCLMNISDSLAEATNCSLSFCPMCLRKLQLRGVVQNAREYTHNIREWVESNIAMME